MANRRVVIAGGSGFLGQSLARELLSVGYQVTILSRTQRPAGAGLEYQAWDGRTVGPWWAAIDGAMAVINLTGRSVNCRYTRENRQEILQSRVQSVQAIHEAVRRSDCPPKVLVQACSLAIYGNSGERICAEDAPFGKGFSAEVCQAWEQAFTAGSTPGVRQVILRIGFALGRDGGALGTLAKLARWFSGGTVGTGRQYISWIHLADLNRMFRWALEREEITGVYSAAGPNPVTNAEFMRALRQALHRPWSPPVPSPLVRLGARLMGTEAELALGGRRCIPARFSRQGYGFAFPDLTVALADLFSASSAPVCPVGHGP